MTTGQEQQIIFLWVYVLVWDGVLELLVFFELSIGGNRFGLSTQSPKDDASEQARVGLAQLPCFCTECYLQARFYKLFPGYRYLCCIEVSVRKRYNYFCSHRVQSSSCLLARVLQSWLGIVNIPR